MRPSPSSPGGRAASVAEPGPATVRQRAISALIFVPPLLVVLVLGMPWIALGLTALAVVGGARGVPPPRRRRAPGPARGSASCSHGSVALVAAAPAVLADKAALLLAVGVVLAAVGAFSRARTPGRADGLGRHGLRGRLRRPHRLRGPARARRARPARRRAAGRARARRGAGSSCSSSPCGRTTRARTSSGGAGAGPGSSPTSRRPRRMPGSPAGIVASTVVVAAMLWALGASPARRAHPGPVAAPRGPGRRPRRVDAQAGGGREGLRRRSSPATAASSTGSTRSCSPPRS